MLQQKVSKKSIQSFIPYFYVMSFVPLLLVFLFTREDHFLETIEETSLTVMLLVFALIVNILVSYKALLYGVVNKRIEVPALNRFCLLLIPVGTLLLFSPFFFSRDFLAYIIPPRGFIEFGLPIYSTSIATEINPWSVYVTNYWSGSSIYGPVFNLLLILLYLPLRHVGYIYFHLLFYKLLIFVVYGLSALTYLKLAKILKINATSAILVFTNPVFVISFLLDGHNDIIVIFFILLFFLSFYKDRSLPSILSTMLAILTKYIPVLFLPILFIKKGSFNVLALVKFVVIFFTSLILSGLIFPTYLAELLSGTHVLFTKYCLYSCSYRLLFSSLLGTHYHTIRLIAFILFSLYFALRFLYMNSEPLLYCFWILFIFSFFFVTFLTPWMLTYLLLITSLLLNRSKYFVHFFMGVTVYSFLIYFGF